MLRKRLWWL